MIYLFRLWIILFFFISAYLLYYLFLLGGKWLYTVGKYFVITTDTFITLIKIPKKRIEQLKYIGTSKYVFSRTQKKIFDIFRITKEEKDDDLLLENDFFLSPARNEVDLEQKKKTAAIVEKIIKEALYHKEKGQFVEYEKKLIAGLAIDPTNKSCIKKLASRYIYTNNHKKALLLLKKLIEQDEQDHEALWQLGDIYIEQGEFEQALLLIQKAIQLAPDRPKYYISLAEIKYNTKELTDAIECMKKAIQLRPANVNYLLTLAGLYEEVGEIDMAKKYYFEILELEPTNTKAKKKINTL